MTEGAVLDAEAKVFKSFSQIHAANTRDRIFSSDPASMHCHGIKFEDRDGMILLPQRGIKRSSTEIMATTVELAEILTENCKHKF